MTSPEAPSSKAGGNIPASLKTKIGPLPAWGWGLVLLGGVVGFWYLKKRGNGGLSAGTGTITPFGDGTGLTGGGTVGGGGTVPPPDDGIDVPVPGSPSSWSLPGWPVAEAPFHQYQDAPTVTAPNEPTSSLFPWWNGNQFLSTAQWMAAYPGRTPGDMSSTNGHLVPRPGLSDMWVYDYPNAGTGAGAAYATPGTNNNQTLTAAAMKAAAAKGSLTAQQLV